MFIFFILNKKTLNDKASLSIIPLSQLLDNCEFFFYFLNDFFLGHVLLKTDKIHHQKISFNIQK